MRGRECNRETTASVKPFGGYNSPAPEVARASRHPASKVLLIPPRPRFDRIRTLVRRRLPPSVTGTLDLLRPSVSQGFGGPFNGQERRIEAVRDMFSRVPFQVVIETGTYRGTTTRFLRRLSGAPMATIEADPRFFAYARLRLLLSSVKVIHGDSAIALRSLSRDSQWRRNPAFFYLDAHWLDALPLRGELETIASAWSDFVVLIDDFAVPGDEAYGYDDYGSAGRLDLDLLAASALPSVAVYWPSAPSIEESGARRGWVVLASLGTVDDTLCTMTTMRRDGTLGSPR